MSVDINMSLEKWHGLVEDVIARTNQVDIEDVVVSHDAKDPFVVIGRVLWKELNNDPSLRLWLDSSFSLTKREDVGLVCEELESCGLTAVVANVE